VYMKYINRKNVIKNYFENVHNDKNKKNINMKSDDRRRFYIAFHSIFVSIEIRQTSVATFESNSL